MKRKIRWKKLLQKFKELLETAKDGGGLCQADVANFLIGVLRRVDDNGRGLERRSDRVSLDREEERTEDRSRAGSNGQRVDDHMITRASLTDGDADELGADGCSIPQNRIDSVPIGGQAPRRSFRDVTLGVAVAQSSLAAFSLAAVTALNMVIKVSLELLNKHLEICKFSIVGRMILSKRDEPWNLLKLKEKLTSSWALKSSCRLISLGRGYYHVILSSVEERDWEWSRSSVNLKSGVLRLQRWSVDFDPLKEKSTHAWEPPILLRLPSR